MEKIHQQHFENYTNLQSTKHKIIREYLNGWFPKLGRWSKRVLYIDTHAGSGKFTTGQSGSPIVALETFLKHISSNICQVDCIFFEKDTKVSCELRLELSKWDLSASNISFEVITEDSFAYLAQLLNKCEAKNKQLPPTFMFVDPFGFTVPCELLRNLKSQPKSEILVNVMCRELDMSIMQPNITPAWRQKLNTIFGCEDWINFKDIEKYEDRVNAIADLFKKQVGAKWATKINMLGDNGVIRYFLLHLTNHDEGRALIKRVFWKCCPDGDWKIIKSESPGQMKLFGAEQNANEIENWLLMELKGGSCKWKELEQKLLVSIWLPKHLWTVIKSLKKADKISIIGKAYQKENPTICLAER